MCLQKLKVLFAVGTDGEVSEPLEVNALSCDTVEQVKEKILATFQAKFGFSYGPPLRELSIGEDPAGFSSRTGTYNLSRSRYYFFLPEYEKNGFFVPLQEVDASSEVLGEVTMLNTLKHYKVRGGGF